MRRAARAEARAAADASAPLLGALLRQAARWTGLRAGSLIGCGAPSGAALLLPWPQIRRAGAHRGRPMTRREQPFGTIELTLGDPA